MDLRDIVSFPSHSTEFNVLLSGNASALQRHPNKAQVREVILTLRENNLSYREISRIVGLHWTRVAQIVNTARSDPQRESGSKSSST